MTADKTLDDISDEISNVKSFLLEAKQSLKQGYYNEAKHFLQKAENISTCSYCKNKMNTFIDKAHHINTLCSANKPDCPEDKDELISDIIKFYDKLPDIEQIRQRKLMQSGKQDDPIGDFMQGLLSPVNAIGQAWDAFLKSFNQ